MDSQKTMQKQIQLLAGTVDRLQSELLATQIALRSLLLTHPDRDRAIKTAASELFRWETAGLNSTAPDSAFAGFSRAKDRFLPSEDDLERVPKNPLP